jgi:hypothetical protein
MHTLDRPRAFATAAADADANRLNTMIQDLR